MMNTYEIRYKVYLGDSAEYETRQVAAHDEMGAMTQFAKDKKIKPEKSADYHQWEWEEGPWYAAFRNIRRIDSIPCPHCDGTGRVRE